MAESLDPAPLSPVVGPSDEERDSDLDLDAALGDNAKGVPVKKGKVPALDDPTHLRAVLGKRCSCKQRDCFGQFSGPKEFAEFLKYRVDFKSLHKLDQDRVDTCQKLKVESVQLPKQITQRNIEYWMLLVDRFFERKCCVLNASIQNKVFENIRTQLESDSSWTFLGREVCLKTWKNLSGIGAWF